MKNADLFKNTFGMYATEIWSMPEKDFLKWLNDDAKQKIGHWIYRIYGEFHEEGNWHCSGCNHIFNEGYGHAEYCPKCGCHMIEAPTEEVNKSYDWIIRR